MRVAGRASGDPNRAFVPGIALLLAAASVAGLAIYGAYLYRHTCFAVGGSDSSGYANAARALVNGPLVSPVPGLERFGLAGSEATAFTPLGYVLLHGPSMAPKYPVGFPLHVAAAAQLAGWELGPYVVSPIAALLVLVLVFLVGRELGLPRGWAAAAAVILAACPVFVFQAIQPMSDVVATAWGLAAIFAALRSRVTSLGSGGGLRFWCGRSRAAPRRARGCAPSFCAARESSSLGPLPRGWTALRGGSLRLRHRVFRQPLPDRIRTCMVSGDISPGPTFRCACPATRSGRSRCSHRSYVWDGPRLWATAEFRAATERSC